MKRETIFYDAVFGDAASPEPAPFAALRQLWLRARSLGQRMLRWRRHTPRRLRLCESLPLGERRFVAVVEFERERFLVGGTSASLVLLARLEGAQNEGKNTNKGFKDEDKVEAAPAANQVAGVSAGAQP